MLVDDNDNGYAFVIDGVERVSYASDEVDAEITDDE